MNGSPSRVTARPVTRGIDVSDHSNCAPILRRASSPRLELRPVRSTVTTPCGSMLASLSPSLTVTGTALLTARAIESDGPSRSESMMLVGETFDSGRWIGSGTTWVPVVDM